MDLLNSMAIGAAIGAVIGFFSAGTGRGTTAAKVNRLASQVIVLQNKLDALLKHQGIEIPTPMPADLSPELQLMAKDPQQKIAAIKLYREENPGTGLLEAKQRIEEFSKTGR
jgi:ribosomal protein L7/L12